MSVSQPQSDAIRNTNIDELDEILLDFADMVNHGDYNWEQYIIPNAKSKILVLLSAAKIQAYDKAIEDAITRTMGINDVAVARERIKELEKQ